MTDAPAYGDGTVAAVGDRVLIEHGSTKAVVECLYCTEQDLAMLDEASTTAERASRYKLFPEPAGPSAMLLSPPFGRVCWSFDNDNDPMRFVRRGTLDRSGEPAGREVDEWW
jgi:hypothetical protein